MLSWGELPNSRLCRLFLTREEAVRELLQSKGGYDHAASTVVEFDRTLVSLPEGVQDRNLLQDLVDQEDREAVVNFRESMMRDVKEVMQLRDYNEEINPYFDQKLRTRRHEYVRFLKMLHSRGLIRWSTTPKEIATPFFVRKRMDCSGLSSMLDVLTSFFEILLVPCWLRPRVSHAWKLRKVLGFMRRPLTWTTVFT